MQIRCSYDANTMQIRCNHGASMHPRRSSHTMMQIRCKYDAIAMQLRCKDDANTMQIPCKYHANTTQIRCHHDSSTMQQPCIDAGIGSISSCCLPQTSTVVLSRFPEMPAAKRPLAPQQVTGLKIPKASFSAESLEATPTAPFWRKSSWRT